MRHVRRALSYLNLNRKSLDVSISDIEFPYWLQERRARVWTKVELLEIINKPIKASQNEETQVKLYTINGLNSGRFHDQS